MDKVSTTVGMAVIGDEILLGEVADENLTWAAERLFALGADLRYSCVLPDDLPFMVTHLKWMKDTFDWVITTGGIGATHDDLTRQAVAELFQIPLVEFPEAVSIFEDKLGSPLPERVRELAMIPEGAELVHSKETSAPGFILENLIVLPGIPRLVRSMFPSIEDRLRGEKIYRAEMVTKSFESEIADFLRETQEKYPEVKIGSYPVMGNAGHRVRLVLRSKSQEYLTGAMNHLRGRIDG
jgi:molybdenum cofactor synthesis domain-containing protein